MIDADRSSGKEYVSQGHLWMACISDRQWQQHFGQAAVILQTPSGPLNKVGSWFGLMTKGVLSSLKVSVAAR